MTERLAVIGGAVVTPFEVIEGGSVLCEDGRIVFVGPEGGALPEPGSRIVNADGGFSSRL